MTLKYLYQSTSILLWALLFSSCLGSSSQNQLADASHDAQIYAFSMTSSKDTARALSGTKFTIDQLNNKIFNQDSLPYRFHVDSILLGIAGDRSSGMSKIILNLRNNDSSYVWNGKDSVAFSRLKSIEITAQDEKTVKLYEFAANIHRQDPYILHWTQMTQNHLPATVGKQKTISHKGKFITYYKSGNDLRASMSPVSDGKTWTPITVSALPPTVKINSIFSVTNGTISTIYAQNADNSIYKSADGLVWSKVASDFSVAAIYGGMPSTSGAFAILVAVDDGGTLKFASTTDFVKFAVKNKPKDRELPITDFSTVSIENPTVHSAKYIILSGGKDKRGTANNQIWIIQEKDGEIVPIFGNSSVPLQLSQLFVYDRDPVKVYLMTYEAGKNKLYYSENYGLDWISGGNNQTLPNNFTSRIQASVLTDSDNYIWIFGGESATQAQIVDVWRGRLNKLAK